ncbi:MAG: hypothetical protein OHK0029_11480 [Armatimonadaceae bacterium]
MTVDEQKRTVLETVLVTIALLGLLIGGWVTGAIQPEKIRAAFQPAVRPEFNPDYLYLEAKRLFDNGDSLLASEVAQRVLHLEKDHILARKLLAAIYLRDRKFEKAAEQCRLALAKHPKNPELRLGLGIALKGMKKNGEARKVFQDLLNDPAIQEQHREEALLQLSEIDGKKPAAPAIPEPPLGLETDLPADLTTKPDRELGIEPDTRTVEQEPAGPTPAGQETTDDSTAL